MDGGSNSAISSASHRERSQLSNGSLEEGSRDCRLKVACATAQRRDRERGSAANSPKPPAKASNATPPVTNSYLPPPTTCGEGCAPPPRGGEFLGGALEQGGRGFHQRHPPDRGRQRGQECPPVTDANVEQFEGLAGIAADQRRARLPVQRHVATASDEDTETFRRYIDVALALSRHPGEVGRRRMGQQRVRSGPRRPLREGGGLGVALIGESQHRQVQKALRSGCRGASSGPKALGTVVIPDGEEVIAHRSRSSYAPLLSAASETDHG